MSEFSTPMMQQYSEIKRNYPHCLLFFRMGDFYELFLEDAHIGARILNITLTGKAGGKDGRIPMAGVPYHAADTYIAKLVRAGYKVAICEQLSPPNKKGLVKRGVIRVVTPGTLIDENQLEKKENNYIVSIAFEGSTYALAIADLSTGYFSVMSDTLDGTLSNLQDELSRLKPAECLLSDTDYNNPEVLKTLSQNNQINFFPYSSFLSSHTEARRVLLNHFQVATLEGFGITEQPTLLNASASLLMYLKETQQGNLPHIKKMTTYYQGEHVLLDRATMLNLELFSTIRDHDTRGSLLSVLDQTLTPMGGRLLKAWLKAPLTDKQKIEERLEAVTYFLEHTETRDSIRSDLKHIPDVERLLARLSVQLGNTRDIIQLKQSLATIIELKTKLATAGTPLLTTERQSIDESLQDVVDTITRIFIDEAPFSVREGGMINQGVSVELDQLKASIESSKNWLKNLEKDERKKTGIATLKVRFNKVFGYYIEISKAATKNAPQHYMRKQTLVNAERFITEELKQHEEIILTTEEKINQLEYKIFLETLENILLKTECIQTAAQAAACIDVLTTFALLAESNHYTKPKLLYSGEIRIKDGRHPVVEQLLETSPFVPNDVVLDNTSSSLMLITGPNMAGKSVLIRQVALIVLMAQIGCYVPATTAHISVVDRIFVRSGASDFITSGLSTFMVEMVETAHILNTATSKSLIIMDEIGRGTSTYDGISIAWAVAEYLVTAHTPSPKVLFATHYHELQALETDFPQQIKNFHLAVTEQDDSPIFLHTLLSGGASHSFGISVAKLAGIPEPVITRAKELLINLERRHPDEETSQIQNTASHSQETAAIMALAKSLKLRERIIEKELLSLDIARMTPLEALNKLASLKEHLILSNSKQTTTE